MSKHGCIYLGERLVSKPVEGTINITENGTYDVTEYDEAIVNVPEMEERDVCLFDYDGTLLYTYTASDFANLSALPDPPTHAGLTFQSWNWTLANAQTYVANNGGLDIGANYITDDGKTRLYITIDVPNTIFNLCWIQMGSNMTTTVNWGDNSSTETLSTDTNTNNTYLTHTYTNTGDYIITLTPSGTYDYFCLDFCLDRDGQGQRASWNGASTYKNTLRKVELGSNITNIGAYSGAVRLESISIPTSVEKLFWKFNNNGYLYWDRFDYCSSLNYVVIPSAVGTSTNTWNNSSTSASDSQYMFYYCSSLKGVSFSLWDKPSAYTGSLRYIIGNDLFYGCSSLKRFYITAPGFRVNYCFAGCWNMEKLVIPNNVEDISSSNMFSYGENAPSGVSFVPIKEIYSMNTTPPTMSSSYTFPATYTYSGYKIYVPASYVSNYTSASGWTQYSTVINAIPS